jgi:hypothetical protein
MNENNLTTIKVRTATKKKVDRALSKDPIAPSQVDFWTEAAERFLKEKYS